ncbi:tumor necrosis factor receptor superfamily member 14-like isoform X1 [Carcharodon carcharias]|uniref:tumor necrosis factor receptor superfamily member 14-like isoform X1 n=1 Tax=Carcharodon carcharias TaxID=13397 RepID=UPI001B7E73B6|nr:tumor necrosis factor receptor superfamily member 14-like isoform X1 [Carcharodon carcharias]
MGITPICFILLLVHYLQVVVCCGQDEYTINGQCCSMCSPGTIVFRHCRIGFGTVCKPCTTGRYNDHPNGLEKCFKCAACDQELGLQVKHECIATQNTVCEAREGYYCIDKPCQLGRKHKTCPPGEGVKEKGTDFTDTVCEVCPEGTYSGTDSSTEACEKWTDCKERNQNQVKLGTSSTDTICEKKTNLVAILVPVGIVVLIIACAVAFFIWKRKRKRTKREGDPHDSRIQSSSETISLAGQHEMNRRI